MDIYNRHRPKTFKEMYPTSSFVSQADRILSNTLKEVQPDLPHFLIFHSEHGGLGKTTAGRIIAVTLNPDIDQRTTDDIFSGRPNILFSEINGGDYRKIDDVRKLGKEIEYQRDAIFEVRKVYMINEAHNLTPHAQDAFLQVTENIPENVYLIFTMTTLANFNEKLLSRAQKYFFSSLDKPTLKKLLLDIESKERGNGLQDYVVDQIFEKCGHSIRESINSLGEYLITGRVSPGISAEEAREAKYFSEIVGKLEDTACGGSVSWGNHMVPIIQGTIDQFSAEEVRIKLVTRLAGLVMGGLRVSGGSSKEQKVGMLLAKSELYRRLAVRLKQPAGYPPKSDLIITLYQAFMDAKDIAAGK